MGNWIKYMIIIILIVVATVFLSYQTTRHHANIASTQEVQAVALQSIDLGFARVLGENRLNKKAIITNLILSIAEKHKGQGQNIEIDYVFFDKDGNVTENENLINSVQFKVKIIDKNGKIVSSSTERLVLDRYIK